MKKQIKPIILSAAAALTFGGIAVGTTFALFTSKAETNIEVNSGIVNVEQTLEIKSVAELGGVTVSPVDDVYTNSIGGKTYVDEDNGSILHLDKWAPGDKAVIEIRNVNKSNVAIRSKFSKTHSSTSSVDLYDALNVSYVAYDADDNDITYLVDDWSTFEPAEDTSVGYLLSRIVVTIEFPDGDNGDILFGDDNHDNQYQDSNCSIYFTQEAVQGNAYTPALIDILNEQLAESSQVNKTMFDALSEVELEANAAHYKHYVWDSLEDQFRYDYSVTPSERYFKVYKEAPVDQTFSIYAEGWTTPSTLELDGVGFDAGNSTLFTAINYVNTSGVAKTNTIRTNSGTLTINAASDIVHHYGYADSLDIIAVAGTSYHEFGEVGYANIANGRLVVEENSNIGGIFLVANNQGEFDDIKLAVVGEATLPSLARADVALADGQSKLVVEVQTLESSSSVDPNPQYVWISKSGTEVTSEVSSSSTEVIPVPAEEQTPAAEATKEETEESAEPIDENSVARINAVGYDSFASAFSAAKSDETLVLLKDVNLTSANTLNKNLNLDLNGKTLNSTATLFNIYGNYNLTIKDSGEDGEINVTANRLIYCSGSGALIKLEGGALNVSSSSTYTYGVSIGSGASFEMTGGSITVPEASTSDYNYCVYNSGSGSITISDGELTGNGSGGNYVVASSSTGDVNISGGRITGYSSRAGWGYAPYVLYMTGTGTANVSGGYFRAVGDKDYALAGHLLEGNGSISGGYFGGVYYYNIPVSAVVDGYQRISNTDPATKGSYQYVVVPVA